MAKRQFRVVDCRTNVIDSAEITVAADTPEHAARLAIGEDLVRGSGTKRVKLLRARVYFADNGALTMVRLYSKADDVEEPKHERGRANPWGD